MRATAQAIAVKPSKQLVLAMIVTASKRGGDHEGWVKVPDNCTSKANALVRDSMLFGPEEGMYLPTDFGMMAAKDMSEIHDQAC